jgi:hypothetical protein
MKKLILLTIALSLTTFSCVTPELTNREAETKITGFDFRKYTERDFLFMPDDYYGEYEVLGIITVELHPTVIYQKGKIGPGPDYNVYYFYSEVPYTQLVQKMGIEELIEKVYEVSMDWGGDGFTNFNPEVMVGHTDYGNPNTAYDYLSVSGVVIKRK